MQAERSTWSDERLDDLVALQKEFRRDVDRCFEDVDRRFDTIEARFDKIDARFDRIDMRFDKLFYLQIYVLATVVAACAAFAGLQG